MVDFQSVVTQLPRNVLFQLTQQTQQQSPAAVSCVYSQSRALSAGAEQCVACSSVFHL